MKKNIKTKTHNEYDVTATIPVAHDIMDMMENYEDYGYYDRLTIVNKGSKDAYIR